MNQMNRLSKVSALPFLYSALSLAGLGAGCGKLDDVDEFRAGVPQHEDVALLFPGGDSAQAALTATGTGVAQSALLNEKAEMYSMTRAITATVNGATLATLGLVKTITEFPPSSLGMDVAVWGPHTNALSPNTWRLTVTREAAGQFAYLMQAKAKTAADSEYLTILSGHHVVMDPGARRRVHLPSYGHGDFVVDWDAAQKLPEHDNNVGKAAFTYTRPSATAPATIDVVFTQIKDDETGMLVDATYGYTETPGAGGTFQFGVTKNAIATTAALETLSVRSRWMQTGTGRSDIKLSQGDLGTLEATSNECWDTNFLSVYRTNSYGDATKVWGAETSCAFATAEYATLP